MGLATEVVWWKRLISALGALVFTLLLTTGLYTINDFRRVPNLHWFNAGESQIVVGLLVYGGLIVLETYVLFVIPLVLIWPAESQRKHWYAMLCVAMLWPPLLTGSIIGRLELFALCSCGCYLFLIHWQRGRLAR
jgi:hypothetical protein